MLWHAVINKTDGTQSLIKLRHLNINAVLMSGKESNYISVSGNNIRL